MRRLLAILLACVSAPVHAQPAAGLKVPPGFEIIEFANEKLANDIQVMTVDPKGRVIVAGRGYIRILIDDDGDGKADRALPFADTPKDGAMGLLWEGDSLYVTGDGGLRKFTSKSGDKADGPSTVLRVMKTGGEHTSHAIRRGPDGWLYVLGGNVAGIDKSYAELEGSPIRDPIAGCVLRFSPEDGKCEIVAHGFRNPYGFDFNLDGDLFTYDSDNERCVSLPWYETTRFYHVIEGRHYGWLNPQHAATWRRPPYFADVVAPIAYLGRGSPTGVACYRHNQFPPEYQGGFFLADWTFGKIHFASLERKGASYTAKTRVFLESQGENGFAPTACAVDESTGDLYISIGGRGTRGAVYRIRHAERFQTMKDKLAPLKMVKRFRVPGTKLVGGTTVTVEHQLRLMNTKKSPEHRLDYLRVLQQVLGDIGARKSIGTIWEGYTPRVEIRDQTAAAKQLAAYFPSNHVHLDYELARTLGMLGHDDAALRLRVLEKCRADSSPVDDIHYLACYARLGGKRDGEEAKIVAGALLDLDAKIVARKLNRDSNWAPRVRELYVGLAEKDAALHQAMVENLAFGRADHALFANTDGFPKEKAARVFLDRWQRDQEFALNDNIAALFSSLPHEDVLPTIRKRRGTTGHEAALLPLLAKKPAPEDRKRFVDGLNSPQSATLLACVEGLDQLDGKDDGAEAFALIRALHRSAALSKPAPFGARVASRLEKITGQKFGVDSKRWIVWLEQTHPEFGKRLANPDGVDVAKWDARLAKLDWTVGNAAEGRAVYAKANCIQCHSGSQALGPDLVGVTNRFSRADLFTAILQPSKDVPARYQMTIVETKSGKTHQGIVVYDAVDSLILQTGAATTVRLDGADVASRSVTAQSLMPAGLLDGLADREIVDLYAYLRNLK